MITQNNFCFEQDRPLIENYDEAINSDELYALHHRLETHFSNGDARPKNCHLSKDELIALNMYFFQPPELLIYMSDHEHRSMHSKGRDRPDVAGWNRGKKGLQVAWNKGKTGWMSEEGRKAVSKATSERNKRNKYHLGMHWKVVDGKRVWYKEEETK